MAGLCEGGNEPPGSLKALSFGDPVEFASVDIDRPWKTQLFCRLFQKDKHWNGIPKELGRWSDQEGHGEERLMKRWESVERSEGNGSKSCPLEDSHRGPMLHIRSERIY
ncbi:hypothetical protein ANN_25003 [Periplaneta americana]|uniref:Uncharacterized protein n=1 Tax=Periplaneta americana TaxID=6978 RepID=A0ABQ8S0D4_PERAM|nr:hypothetical protein ANN_25003 [Periplaneta americana]